MTTFRPSRGIDSASDAKAMRPACSAAWSSCRSTLGRSIFVLSLGLANPCAFGASSTPGSAAAFAAATGGRSSCPCAEGPLRLDRFTRGAIETDRRSETTVLASRILRPWPRPIASIASWSPAALAVTPDDDIYLDLDAADPAQDPSMQGWLAFGAPAGLRLSQGQMPSGTAAALARSVGRSQDGVAPAASPPVTPDPVTPDRSSVDPRPQAIGAENAPTADEITPQLEEAVRKGFEYLRRQQKTDGAFGQGRFGQHVGVTSLCAIAFMADGNVPGRGDFSEQVEKALNFVLSHSTETGLLVSDQTHGPMYGHGFATLFLGEIYGMNRDDDRVRDALVRAVQLIVASQNNEGGWRYNPVPDDADVSVTICQVMALRSARNAGIKVPKSTIDDATRYVRACQNADGGFRYMKDLGGSAWPRTAAGVASLFYAGVYEDQSIERGLDYLRQHAFPRGNAAGIGGGFSQPHYFYGHYYAVQAMYLAGGDRWKDWWPAIRDELLAKQGADGSWTDPQGDAYGTAMALIVLQMPKRYLPIFQR